MKHQHYQGQEVYILTILVEQHRNNVNINIGQRYC